MSRVPSHRVRAGRHVTIRIAERRAGSYDLQFEGSAGLSKLMSRVFDAGMRVVTGRPAEPPWTPLEPCDVHPATAAPAEPEGEFFQNDLYHVNRMEYAGGLTHLSIKRQDKTRVREWRHLQQIKNELAGAEREAVEVFPAESRLVDQADQYHLWVLPEGRRIPFGFAERTIATPEEAEVWDRQHGVVVDQSAWAPGLTTGRGDH